ncbi:hypothetical protein CUU66_02700 [Peribacillus deserti]|uniref:Uncharacterized protein n=1 Tax=Peribacillus deserti TaxID=673318 RepID=A0A2N5MAN1_9BACI|nr:hypothetical protein CUU66_02700 [Peribacillus deserti]
MIYQEYIEEGQAEKDQWTSPENLLTSMIVHLFLLPYFSFMLHPLFKYKYRKDRQYIKSGSLHMDPLFILL